MLNKKGMSPLLLTIILIAFAVALGAMVMSWGSNKIYSSKESCENIDLTVQKAFDKELICYNKETGKLKIVIKNTGQGKFNAIVYRRITPDLSTRDILLPSSNIDPGKIYEAEIPFQQGERTHIEIIPQVKDGEAVTICSDKAIIRETILDCTA